MIQKTNVKPRFWILLVLVMVCVSLIARLATSRVMADQRAEIAQLTVQADELARKDAALDRELEFAKTDEFVERVARNELGLLKPGEVRLVAGSTATGSESVPTNGQ